MKSRTKNIILSLFLFLIVFVILGIPFTHWWFNGCDDFQGLYVAFTTKTWAALLNFFPHGNLLQIMGPSNTHSTGPSYFFSTYYRPLYYVYITLQYWLFGTNGYWYFLCNVFFHAINTALLFTIFHWFTGSIPAFLTALLFAVHPQIGYRFGAIVNFHYYVNVTLCLLIFMLGKRYLDTKKMWLYVLACLLFAISLFTRESSIVLPLILLWAMYLYKPSQSWWFYIKQMLGFGFVGSAFLLLRLYLYPLAPISSTFNMHTFLQTKATEGLVALYDIFSLSWLPWGHPLLRASMLGTCGAICLILFVTNTRKKYIIFCLTSTAIMLWPAYIGHYSPRYMYEAYYFVLLAFIFCFQFSTLPMKKIAVPGLITLSLFVIFNGICTIENFYYREQKMAVVAVASENLVAQQAIKNRALCLLSYPMDGLGDQPAHMLKVLRNDDISPIYCDTSGALVQADANIIQTTWWRNVISTYYTQNYVHIHPIPGGFRFVSDNPRKIHFFLSDEKNGYSVGKKIIHRTELVNNGYVITDFNIIIDQHYAEQKPVFITWNYETKLFEIIGLKTSA